MFAVPVEIVRRILAFAGVTALDYLFRHPAA
jgi:hypothetical protein